MSSGLRSELFGGSDSQSQNHNYAQQTSAYSGSARAASDSNDWYTGDASYNTYSGSGSVGAVPNAESGGYGDAFTPQTNYGAQAYTSHGFDAPKVDEIGGMVGGAEDDDYVEPPLLEELEINFAHIWTKTAAVMVPTRKIDPHILEDSDLAGPLVFFFIQGFCLLLRKKLYFGYIFGTGTLITLFLYAVLNLMSQKKSIDSWHVLSVFGYGLLPIVLLSALTLIIDLRGSVVTLGAVVWSTQTATRFFEAALDMRPQRWLIAYPVLLTYACFALIIVF